MTRQTQSLLNYSILSEEIFFPCFAEYVKTITFNFTDLATFSEGKQLTLEIVHMNGTTETIMLNHTYNEAQIDWFKAGSALNLIRKQNT